MSYPIQSALEAEIAYRRERLLGQVHPKSRSIGAVRQSRRARADKQGGRPTR
jgi:hypothetical protein